MTADMNEVAEVAGGLVRAARQNPVMAEAIVFAASSLYASSALIETGERHAALERSLQGFQDRTRDVFHRMEAVASGPHAYVTATHKH